MMRARIEMHRRQLWSTVAAIGFGLILVTVVQAADADSKAAADAKDWIPLFNGKDLTGWHKNPEKIGHGTGGHWHVEEGGVLAGEQDPPGSGNGGILLTDRKFENFELSLEMKPSWASSARTTRASASR
jgi:hypothetical protein